ncbi:MAG TPA: energy transducer TonB [Methylocystis sp.]|nr:energy transducer TonB [Methylocystis sp.]
MSLAAAPRYEATYGTAANDAQYDSLGAQTLLHLEPPRPNYFARVAAIVLYFALLAGFVTIGFRSNETPIEDEQVIELAPLPPDEQPVEDTPPPPEQLEMPDIPPPMALDPIAPIEEPKPVEKPRLEKPKVEKPVERREPAPTTRHEPAPHVAAPAVRAPAAPPGATPSAIANQFHACMQRAASGFDAPLAGRVSYHATFSASGSMTSYSISPSGKGAIDSIANRLGARCGSVPAPGRPVSLSGAISFSP